MKPLSMANASLLSTSPPSIFYSKLISIPNFKPTISKLHLPNSSLPFSLPKKSNCRSIVAFVATQEQEESTVNALEEEQEQVDVVSEFAETIVGNLPYELHSEKLAEFFTQAGLVKLAQVIQRSDLDPLTISTVEEAEKAVELLKGYFDLGRKLKEMKTETP